MCFVTKLVLTMPNSLLTNCEQVLVRIFDGIAYGFSYPSMNIHTIAAVIILEIYMALVGIKYLSVTILTFSLALVVLGSGSNISSATNSNGPFAGKRCR